MNVEIKKLTREFEHDYDCFLADVPYALFYHSLGYRHFLKAILPDSEDYYLLAYEGGRLVGILPLFIKNGMFGVVVNSLPFYGSNGGLLCHEMATENVAPALLVAFDEVCEVVNAISSTIVDNPLQTAAGVFLQYDYDYLDKRIGQITALPSDHELSEIDDKLMKLFHTKTRNMVRKGLRGNFFVEHDGSPEVLQSLQRIHEKNIQAVGGLAKPIEVFTTIAESFVYDRDYRIYYARTEDGEIASCLLLFYFKQTIEYFTPATVEKYRADQPLSLLIFIAMRDAIFERKSKIWNWGGTWESQEGVYRFKSRWGAEDYPYRYFIKEYIRNGDIKQYGKSSLLNAYPFFYTIPFSQVQ